MGRLKGEKKSKVNMTVWLDPDVVEIVKRVAAKAEIAPSALLRNLIEVNVRELDKMDKMGLFKLSVILKDLQSSLRAWVEHAEDCPEYVGECI